MSQITLYVDETTQNLVEQAATASGLSKSRWVAEIIQKSAAHEWTKGFAELARRFADFPLREIEPSDSKKSRLVGVPTIVEYELRCASKQR